MSDDDLDLDLDALGDDPTGGLTFEPPRARGDDAPALGFAPDLDEDVPHGIDWTSAPAAAPAPSRGESVVEEARARRGPPRYPLAEAALARLLGEDLLAARPRPGDDGSAFTLGPAVMRPPPAIALPSPADVDLPPPEGAVTSAGPSTDSLMEDMVDVMLVGDDDGTQHVHLAFKEDVFGGLYLKLERASDGLFATFLVSGDRERRGVEGHVDLLLSRLRDRGMRITGHTVEVRQG